MQVIKDKIRQQPWFAERVKKLAEKMVQEAKLEASAISTFKAQAERDQLCIEWNNFLHDSITHYSYLNEKACTCLKYGDCPACDKSADEILGIHKNFPN